MPYTFKDIPITKDIQYIPCFQNFTCTNIEVPLDYDDASAGTTNIAFIKHTARKQPAKGDIIYNPGGPGASAVGFMIQPLRFPALPRLLGDEWNIIGMDPRGVNNSGPNLDCFDGKPEIRDYYDVQYSLAVDSRSDASLRAYFANAGGFGDWCSQTLKDEANYANTPATARDMLHYAESLAETQGKPKEEAKLNFFGASYGSALGNTFAQLYPDRVGKFVIDGNLDVEDYYWGSWGTSLRQSDEAVQAFFDTCFKAGRLCPFFRNDSSSESIKGRFDKILEDMEAAPITVADSNIFEYPTVVTHMDARAIITQNIYNSIQKFKPLAAIFADLENGNATSLTAAVGKGMYTAPAPPAEYSGIQPKLIVACNDNNGRYNVSTFDKLKDLYADNRAKSKYLGETWAQVIVPQCRNLRFRSPPNQQFHGKTLLTRTYKCGFASGERRPTPLNHTMLTHQQNSRKSRPARQSCSSTMQSTP
jgi:pimeloyl-ACP methyl ester carboxylesterase